MRATMADAAGLAKLPPLRLGFTDSLYRLKIAILRMAEAATGLVPSLYRQLLEDIARCVLRPRRLRHNPRVVKVKMSGYPLKRVNHAKSVRVA